MTSPPACWKLVSRFRPQGVGYYVLGYYTSNANLDGKFRRIKISLREGLTASLDYRQGYYAGSSSPSSPQPTRSDGSRTR